MPRRGYQQLFEIAIQAVLDKVIPLNVEAVRRKVSEKLGKDVSWNTVKKYLLSLRDAQKIEEIHAGKLTLYKLR